jgi:VTC domain
MSLESVINKFEPISLADMDSVKLMDRTDTKFTFNLAQLPQILEDVLLNYRVLEVDGKRISRYKTLYFDTKELDLYTKHHNGQSNRYKIRHRTYVESNLGFLEVKFKNNKGRTIKNRIKNLEVPENWQGKNQVFLNNMLPFEPSVLIPAVWVNYSRLTLVNKTSAERLTIDLDLEFERDTEKVNLSKLVIAEVKQEKRKSSPILTILKKYHIREGSISKYCMAIAMTSDSVKKNNFKEKLLNVKQILNL